MRPVSDELHLWCSVPWTVMMHETSNDHWFTFAFNYCLAQTAHVCVCVCVCVAVWLCVCVCVKVWERDPQSALTGQRYFHPHLCIATQQQTTKSLLLPLLEQKVKYDPEPTFSRVQFPLTPALVFQDVQYKFINLPLADSLQRFKKACTKTKNFTKNPEWIN